MELVVERSPGRSANVWLISLTIGIIVTALFTWSRLLPLMLTGMGASDAEVGFAYALLSLATTLCQIPGGMLADRFGRKLLIVVPTYLMSGCYVLAARSGTWQEMVAWLVVINVVGAGQSPAFVALVAESVPADRRGFAFAALQFFLGLSVALGPALGALWVDTLGVEMLMTITGWTFLGVAVIRHVTLVETAVPMKKWAVWKPDWSWPLVRVLAVGSLFIAISSLTVWGPFISLYSSVVRGFSGKEINLLFSVGSLASVVFSFVGGKATDRLGPTIVLASSTLIHVVVCLMFLWMRTLLSGAVMLTAAFGSMQAATVAWDTMRAALVEGEARGTAVGVIGTITAGAAAGAPAVAGVMTERWGLVSPFVLALFLGAVLVVLTMVGNDRK